MAPFTVEVPFDTRLAEARRILAKYPERVPVICERAARADIPEIEKKKFLVPGTMLCGEFKYIVHQQVSKAAARGLQAEQTIYLFVENNSPRTGTLLSELYEQHCSGDGFLYFTYSAENTLGAATSRCPME